MDDTTTFPTHLLPDGYLEHFKIGEFKFRWHQASGLDSNLHFRANHLASRLISLWITDGHLVTAKHVLARITNTSIRTMDRALLALEDRGWVQVSRDGDGLSIFLVIPEHGFQALMRERKSSEQERSLRLTRELATQVALCSIAGQYDVDSEMVKFAPEWKIVRSRVRSVISRMGDVEVECKKLVEAICESIPVNVRCPQALISSRIDDHLRRHTHLSHRPTKSTRMQSQIEPRFDIQGLIASVSDSLSQGPLLAE